MATIAPASHSQEMLSRSRKVGERSPVVWPSGVLEAVRCTICSLGPCSLLISLSHVSQ